MNITAVIIDDEENHRIRLQEELLCFPNIKLIGEYGNATEALRQLPEKNPDLVFLDIEMPDLNGFEILDNLKSPPVAIIHTSFPGKYSEKAFLDYAAIGLLPKPFSKEQLNKSLDRAMVAICEPQLRQEWQETQKRQLGQSIELKRRIGNSLQKRWVAKKDILCVKAEKNQNHYYFLENKEDEPFSIDQTLTNSLSQLGEDFMQVHKSWIISLRHWETLTSNHVRLKNFEHDIPIGRAFKEEVQKKWNDQRFASQG